MTNKNKLELEEVRKVIVNLATLVQNQQKFVEQHIESINKSIDQLKIDQEINMNEFMIKLENMAKAKETNLQTIAKSYRRKKFKFVGDLAISSASETDEHITLLSRSIFLT